MALEIPDVAPDAHPSPAGPWALAALAALVAVALLWARGLPDFVAWELAQDHQRCFGRPRLRARLWTSEPWEVRDWLEARGTPVQPLPRRVGDLELVGVRYCPLYDRVAAHVYYADGESRASVFVLRGPARIRDGWAGKIGGLEVRMLRSAGRTLAIVGSVDADVEALARAFRSSVA